LKGGGKYMKKTSLFLGLTALVVGSTLLVPQAAQAYKGDPNVKGPNYTSERHEAMTKAFENKDYNAWKSLMQGRGRVMQIINAQNFARFAEAHKLALEGKTSEANKIKTELGLGVRNGTGMGQGMGYGQAAK